MFNVDSPTDAPRWTCGIPLCTRYVAVFFRTLIVDTKAASDLVWALGIHRSGSMEVLGAWHMDSSSASEWLVIEEELRSRGVQEILCVQQDAEPDLRHLLSRNYPEARLLSQGNRHGDCGLELDHRVGGIRCHPAISKRTKALVHRAKNTAARLQEAIEGSTELCNRFSDKQQAVDVLAGLLRVVQRKSRSIRVTARGRAVLSNDGKSGARLATASH